jgi:hypothetical protein
MIIKALTAAKLYNNSVSPKFFGAKYAVPPKFFRAFYSVSPKFYNSNATMRCPP